MPGQKNLENNIMRKALNLRALALLSLLAAPVSLFSKTVPNPDAKGPFEVGFTTFTALDPSRATAAFPQGRPIPVYVWYPVDPTAINAQTSRALYPLDPYFGGLPVINSLEFEAHGLDKAYQAPSPSVSKPFPLIVFSPGWGTGAYDHVFLGTRLASHGFVVAALFHYGSGIVPGEPFEHIAWALFHRPRDVSSAIDRVLARNSAPSDPLFGLVQPEKIVASGWSLGGYAALTLAGGDDSAGDVCADFRGWPTPPETLVPSLPDGRVKAIVTLDGSNQCLKFTELARIHMPALGLGEEWTKLATGMPGMETWQARQHAAMSGHPSYRIDVTGAEHQSFSNTCASNAIWAAHGLDPWATEARSYALAATCDARVIQPSEAFRLVTKYMIAFLTKTVIGSPGYQPILTPGYAITSEPLIEFFETEKRSPNAINEDWPDYFTYFLHQPGTADARGPKDLQLKPAVKPPGR